MNWSDQKGLIKSQNAMMTLTEMWTQRKKASFCGGRCFWKLRKCFKTSIATVFVNCTEQDYTHPVKKAYKINQSLMYAYNFPFCGVISQRLAKRSIPQSQKLGCKGTLEKINCISAGDVNATLKFSQLPKHLYHKFFSCAVSSYEISNELKQGFHSTVVKWIILCSHSVLKSWDKFIFSQSQINRLAIPPLPVSLWDYNGQWCHTATRVCIRVNKQSNHHRSVQNKAQSALQFQKSKRRQQDSKKSVSRAFSKATFLRNCEIKGSVPGA